MSRNSLAPKPLKKPSPDTDSRFKRTMTQLKTGAAKTKAHPPASKKAAEAAKASKGPPNELVAGGKAKQVDKIKEAKEGKPEQSSFLAMLRAEIEKVMPKTLGETDNFDQTAQQMKGGLKGNVAEQKEKSTADVSGASKQTPGPAGTAKAAEPLPKEGAPPPPQINAAGGMPAPKTDAEVSQKDGPADVKDEFAKNDLDQKSLPKANDPRFNAADQAAKEVNKNAETAPAKYRAAEKTSLSAAASKAAGATKVGAAQMVGVRSGGNAKVLTRQQQQKAKDEAKRKEVVDKIESIYTATKGRVEAKLNALDGEVNGIFDRGVDAALNAMTKFVNAKIRDYKIRRYLSIPLLGLAAWVKDQFMGLPDEVNAYYEQGRSLFQGLMDALIVRVANLVEQRLKEAKQEVAKGQAEIKAFVASQPKDLQQVAQQAQSDVEGRFKELESGIEEKKNALAQSLAQKYKEGFDKANEALKAIQDSNKGLVAGFLEKLGEVIKALLEFKAKLMAILRKGADTIKLILADPLGFLGNLISAVKGGVSAFGANIWTHLKAGFMRWLLGNAPPGIAIPSDFSPASIFKLVMGVLGITYDKMRAKAVKLLGPTAVTVIETLVKYVKALIDGGPAKLWEEVKADLSNLKDMVIGAFQDWLITTVIQKAIVKIVSMFNPAGAIVQAVMAIVSIVQFVVEKAAQIAEFVSSVIDSIHAIATGSIGGAVKRIESALGNAIPLLIGFLASLVGLGGVAAKIREFVMKAQAKVDAAIDKVLKKIVDTVKKLIGKLGGKDKKAEDRTPQQKERDARAAVADAKSASSSAKSVRSLRAKLQQIKTKYRLTSISAVGKKPKSVTFTAEINPKATGDGTIQAADVKSVAIQAKGALDGATAKASTVKTATQAEIAAMSGTQYEEHRREQLKARPNAIPLPTRESHVRPSTAVEPHGVDAAFLITPTPGSVEGATLEFNEMKKRGRMEVFVPVSSKKGANVEGTPEIIQAVGKQPGVTGSQVTNKMLSDPALLTDVMTKEKSLIQQGARDKKLRKLENKLSSLTTAFDDAMKKMLGYMDQLLNDPAVTDEVKATVRAILAGKGGTMKFVLDVREGVKIVDKEKELAKKMIEKAFEMYMAASKDIKTKLEVVIRTVDPTTGKAEEVKL